MDFEKVRRLSNMYYNDGLKKAEVRNLSGAIISLKKSLKFNKYNVDARNLLGLVYYEMGEVVDALSEWVISKSYKHDDNIADRYLDAIRQNRAQLDAINQTIKKYNQALLYCKQDSRDLAIIQLKKVLALNPHLVKAHQLLALLYLQEDRLEMAKKTLRDAGKIDANNTTTLRYLKEVNLRLKEKNKNKKKKDDEDILSYQSGNETIIMPKRFRDSSLDGSLLYLVMGLIVGALVIGFLIVPTAVKNARDEVAQELSDSKKQLSENSSTISFLEAEIEALEKKITDLAGPDGLGAESIVAYESLLSGYVCYTQADPVKAGAYLVDIDKELLSTNAKAVYDTAWAAVAASYYDSLFNDAYNKYAAKEYQAAIDLYLKLEAYDKNFKNGDVVYYLAQSYYKLGNMESAKAYYQYIIDTYPETDRAAAAKKFMEEYQKQQDEAAQGEASETIPESTPQAP